MKRPLLILLLSLQYSIHYYNSIVIRNIFIFFLSLSISIIFTFLVGHILDRFTKLLLLKTVRWHILIRVDSMARKTNFLPQLWLLVAAIIIILILRKIIFTQRMRFLNNSCSSVVLEIFCNKKDYNIPYRTYCVQWNKSDSLTITCLSYMIHFFTPCPW